MRAAFANTVRRNDHNPVGIFNCSKPVGDYKVVLPSASLFKASCIYIFGRSIECARCFIQY